MIKDTEFPNQGIPPKSLPLLHMKNHLQQYLYHLALILALCVCGILGSAEVSGALPAATGVEVEKITISDVVAERDGGDVQGEWIGNFTKSEALHKFKSNPDGPAGIIAKISDLGAAKMQDLLSDLKIINAQGDAIGDELLEFFLAADDLPAFERRLKAWEVLSPTGLATDVNLWLPRVSKWLDEGLEFVESGPKVIIKNGADEVGEIVNDVLYVKYTGFGGDVICDASKTTTAIGRWSGGTEDLWNSGLAKQVDDITGNPSGLNIFGIVDNTAPPAKVWSGQNKPWLDAAIGRG